MTAIVKTATASEDARRHLPATQTSREALTLEGSIVAEKKDSPNMPSTLPTVDRRHELDVSTYPKSSAAVSGDLRSRRTSEHGEDRL